MFITHTEIIRTICSLGLIIIYCFGFGQETDKIQIAAEYYQQGEFDKALTLYDELSKDQRNTQLISSNYISLLQSQQRTKDAEKFLKLAIKTYPNNSVYPSKLAGLYNKTLQLQKLETLVESLFEKNRLNPFQLSKLAQNFTIEKLYPESISFYNKSREIRDDPAAHALELASIYREMNDKKLMLEEYLNYASSNPNRLEYVKNLLQNYLSEEEDFNDMESTLISKMQQDPEEIRYPELMVWLQLQRKNFYGAFIQSKAIDKRLGKAGDRSMQIGRIALENKDYAVAEEIFAYVAKEYREGRNFPYAKKYWMQAREQKIKTTYPVEKEEIRALANEYGHLYHELKPTRTANEALRNKALLHAFYLNEIEEASTLLNQVIANSRARKQLISKSKLDLGDIYLLKGEPWESTLLYSQVEKANKDSDIGNEAKLRNARLNYFTGNFALSKGHLDILKRNTTREISNDAIALGMLIADNTAFDSTDIVLKNFADIELLIFQNRKDEAKKDLEQMLRDYQNHSITDEIFWLLSKLELEAGNFTQSIEYLDKILEKYRYDILADDAAYKKAEIIEYHIKNREQSQMLYQQFLVEFPGSIYAAEARKRFRKLRGDVLN